MKWLAIHAEDIALGSGALCIALGVGLAFSWPFGLIAGGVLLVAYGVWISPGRP